MDVYRIKEGMGLSAMSKTKCLRIAGIVILTFFIGKLMLRLNHLTPFVADDFLKYKVGIEHLHNWSDFVSYLYGFYTSWGGRIWGELFLQLAVLMPKPMFDMLNTAAYLLFIALIYFNIVGRVHLSISLFLLVNFFLVACSPAFGQTFFWIAGSTNYLWSILLPLAFLLVWKIYDNNSHLGGYAGYRHPIFVCLTFLLGLMTGWANENTSVGIVCLLIFWMMTYRQKEGHTPPFAWAGFLGTVFGSLLLWLASGNFTRLHAGPHPTSFLAICHNIVLNAAEMFNMQTGFLLLLPFVVLVLFGHSQRKWLASFYIIAAFISSMAFSVTGTMWARTWFGCIVLLIIGVGMVYEDGFTVDFRSHVFRIVLSFLLIGGLYFYAKEAKNEIQDYANRWQDNVHIIETAREHGNFDPVVNPITPQGKFCAAYHVTDLSADPKYWANTGVASYYHVNSVRVIYVTTDDAKSVTSNPQRP